MWLNVYPLFSKNFDKVMQSFHTTKLFFINLLTGMKFIFMRVITGMGTTPKTTNPVTFKNLLGRAIKC
jgi:hypothetical protein